MATFAALSGRQAKKAANFILATIKINPL